MYIYNSSTNFCFVIRNSIVVFFLNILFGMSFSVLIILAMYREHNDDLKRLCCLRYNLKLLGRNESCLLFN